MSIQQVPERSCKKLYHYRRNSDELDVFEAARYFSGANEVSAGYQKMLRSGGRNSLDITILSSTRSSTNQAQTHLCNDVMMEKATTKEKKYKQPNSPGGRLASFLNSLFSQSSSKKKKLKSCSAQSMKDDEDHEIPGGRRKRRSSISHFRSFNSTNNSSSADNSKSSSFYSSSSPEFTTHPSITTPTKNTCKDSKNFLDHHKPAVLLKSNCHIKSTASQKDVHHDTRKISTNHDDAWLDDDDFKFSTTTTTNSNNGFPSERGNIFLGGSHEKNQPAERDFRNLINEMDDGADSDSSSDLFELQNYDLGCGYSSGLPVYETTHMNSIKRGAPITS